MPDSATDLATDLATADPFPGVSLDDLAYEANHGRDEDKAVEALAELKRRTKGDPPALIKAAWGNLARTVAALLTEEQLKNQPAMKAAVQARHKEIRESLEGPDPTVIEALLAERAALNWLHLHMHEIGYSFTVGSSTPRGREHLERVRDRLDRRYISSLKALASVRRLDLASTTLTVTLAQQNIHNHGATGSAGPMLDRS